jgi:hypothetical protein
MIGHLGSVRTTEGEGFRVTCSSIGPSFGRDDGIVLNTIDTWRDVDSNLFQIGMEITISFQMLSVIRNRLIDQHTSIETNDKEANLHAFLER